MDSSGRQRKLAYCIVSFILVSLAPASWAATTLTMDELPFQPVDNLSFNGVTFDFKVGGSDSTDANYHSAGPGSITYVQDPSIEGNAAGTLTLDFAQVASAVNFGVALSTSSPLSPGFSVQVFDANLASLGVFPTNTQPLVSHTEGQFSYSGVPARRLVVTFNTSQASRFAFDNLTLTTGICGNGQLDPGEQCDDGNTANNDGCSATCTREAPTCCSCLQGAGQPFLLCQSTCEAQTFLQQVCMPLGSFQSNVFYLLTCSQNSLCPTTETGHCADTADNDRDGLIDCNDPDCAADAACRPPTATPTSTPTPSSTPTPTVTPTRTPTTTPTWTPRPPAPLPSPTATAVPGTATPTATTTPAVIEDKDQQSCIYALGADGAKVAAAQGKENAACVNLAGKGQEPEVASCLTADAKGKVGKAFAKTENDESQKCRIKPHFGFRGADAVNAAARTESLGLVADVFGVDLDAAIVDCAVNKAGCACQAAVARDYEKIAMTKFKEYLTCVKAVLKGGASSRTDLEGCVTPDGIAGDAKGKVAKAITKLGSDISKKCAANVFPGLCAEVPLSSLPFCLDELVECRVCRAINAMHNLDVDCDLFDDGVANETCQAAITCGQAVDATLQPTDTELFGDGTWTDAYTFTLEAPATVTFTMSASGFDPYLWIAGADAVVAAGRSPQGGALLPDTYTVIANNFSMLPAGSYAYQLTMSCNP